MKIKLLIVTILAVLLSAFCLLACNKESGNSIDIPIESNFTITKNGEVNVYESSFWLNAVFDDGDFGEGNYFAIQDGIAHWDYRIVFPYSQYNKNIESSYFKVGYSDFGSNATDIICVSGGAGWYGEYVSGSAIVTKNDGKYIRIQFSNYKFEVERKSITIEFIFNGTVDYLIY